MASVFTLVLVLRQSSENRSSTVYVSLVSNYDNCLQAYNLLSDSSIGANVKYVLHKLLILEHDQVRLLFSKDILSMFPFYDKGVIKCGKD